MKHDARAAAIIGLVIVAASIFLGFKFHQRNPVDTDILSLLPADRSTPSLADALLRVNAVAANRVALLIEGGTADARGKAAADLTQALDGLGFFKPSATEGRALWDWVFANRTALLCPKDLALLQAGRGREIADDALRQWYAPFGIANSGLLKSDPLLLTPRLMKCLLGSTMAMPST